MRFDMLRLLPRALVSLVLLGLAGLLSMYGFATYKIASRDVECVRNNPLFDVFSEAWLFKGHLDYYGNLDPAAAAKSYRMAISREPSSMSAWISLARAEIMVGHKDEARRIMGIVSPALADVSAWKWQELLLAFELHDDAFFEACLNYILARLPHRVPEACSLALQFWGTWAEAEPHIAPDSGAPFLDELMRAQEPEVALSLWSRMRVANPAPEGKTRLSFCNFLLERARLQPAKAVWSEWCAGSGQAKVSGNGPERVYDGGFELQPLNTAFGWRLGRLSDVMIERSAEAPFAGAWSLHLRFLGTKNLELRDASQIIPVEPGATYHLSFARKSRNLTTDKGIFIELGGYRCEGLSVRSEPVLGTTTWTREDLEVPVPAACEAIVMTVRRNESLKFDSKITGDYWLDAVQMDR